MGSFEGKGMESRVRDPRWIRKEGEYIFVSSPFVGPFEI